MENQSSSNGAIIAVLVIVVIAVVGWLAYSQGLFKGSQQGENDNTKSIEVKLDTGSNGDDTSGGSGQTPSNP